MTSLYTLTHDFKVKTHIQQTINQPPSDSVTPTQTHMLSTKKYSRVFLTTYQTSWKISFKTCLCVSQMTSSYHLPCPSPKRKSTTFSECQNHATDEHTSCTSLYTCCTHCSQITCSNAPTQLLKNCHVVCFGRPRPPH